MTNVTNNMTCSFFLISVFCLIHFVFMQGMSIMNRLTLSAKRYRLASDEQLNSFEMFRNVVQELVGEKSMVALNDIALSIQ